VSDSSPPWTRLYLARWPDGTVTLLSGLSLEHVVDQLDQVGDAGAAEVVPFERDLWLTFRPSNDPEAGLLTLTHQPTAEIDSQADVVELSFPVLHRLVAAATIEHDDGDHEDVPIQPAAWNEALAIEHERILSPSPEWRRSIEAWWASLGPAEPDS
jgi:hypothetical protein